MVALLLLSACGQPGFGVDFIDSGSVDGTISTDACFSEDALDARAWTGDAFPRPVPLRDHGWLPLVHDGEAAWAVFDLTWSTGEPFAQFEVTVRQDAEVLGAGEAALAGARAGDTCRRRYGPVVVDLDAAPVPGAGPVRVEVTTWGQTWASDAAWTVFATE